MIDRVLELACATNEQLRGVRELQPVSEAERKLFTTDPAKPGELAEILEVLDEGGEPWELADELADVMYYASQLGRSQEFVPLARALGFTRDEAFRFSLVKYGCRVERACKDKAEEQRRIREVVATLPRRPCRIELARELIANFQPDR